MNVLATHAPRMTAVKWVLGATLVWTAITAVMGVEIWTPETLIIFGAVFAGCAVIFSKQVKTIVENLSGIAQTLRIKDIVFWAITIAVYVAIGTAGRFLVLPFFESQLSTYGTRTTYTLAILTTLGISIALLHLFSSTGFPLNAELAKKARNGLFIVVSVVWVGLMVLSPQGRVFFDVQNGDPLVMHAPDGGKIYNLSPKNCGDGCFSPSTGERLVPITTGAARNIGPFSAIGINPETSEGALASAGPTFGLQSSMTMKDGVVKEIWRIGTSWTRVPFTLGFGSCVSAFPVSNIEVGYDGKRDSASSVHIRSKTGGVAVATMSHYRPSHEKCSR